MARIGDGGDLLKCSFCGKSQKQVKKEMEGFPLRYVQTIDVLPWQHIILFEKK